MEPRVRVSEAYCSKCGRYMDGKRCDDHGDHRFPCIVPVHELRNGKNGHEGCGGVVVMLTEREAMR